jgi:biopolymer transport protein TolR
MTLKHNILALDAQINIVPYLDVFLVLAVILMASVSPLYHQAEVELPKVTTEEKSSCSAKQIPLIITLDKMGSYHLRNRYIHEHDLTPQKLFLKMRAFHQKDIDQKVMLEADKECSYDQVMALIGLLHRAGFVNVALVTQPELYHHLHIYDERTSL